MSRRKHLPWILALGALILLASPAAFASDGVVLINQATAVNGLPGCSRDGNELVVICRSGSYQLAGNLTAVTGDAIHITAPDVTLDLGGFQIEAPTNAVLVSANGVAIRNGSVVTGGVGGRLFPSDGIELCAALDFGKSRAGTVSDLRISPTAPWDNTLHVNAGILLSDGAIHDVTIQGGLRIGIVATDSSGMLRIDKVTMSDVGLGAGLDSAALITNSTFNAGSNSLFGFTNGYVGGNVAYGDNLFTFAPLGGNSFGNNVCGIQKC